MLRPIGRDALGEAHQIAPIGVLGVGPERRENDARLDRSAVAAVQASGTPVRVVVLGSIMSTATRV